MLVNALINGVDSFHVIKKTIIRPKAVSIMILHHSTKKLYRSVDDRILAGVCGGLAETYECPSWLVRVIFVGSVIIIPLFLILCCLYIIAAFRIPSRPSSYYQDLSPFSSKSEIFHERPSSYETESIFSKPSNFKSSEEFEMMSDADLDALLERCEQIDKRLQKIEAIVTSPQFTLESELKNL